MKTIAIALGFMLLISSAVSASDKENKKFLDATIKKFKEECKEEKGMDYLNCWADHSPEKCKSLVYAKDKSAWARCVYSCGSAGIYSKTFGDCSD